MELRLTRTASEPPGSTGDDDDDDDGDDAATNATAADDDENAPIKACFGAWLSGFWAPGAAGLNLSQATGASFDCSVTTPASASASASASAPVSAQDAGAGVDFGPEAWLATHTPGDKFSAPRSTSESGVGDLVALASGLFPALDLTLRVTEADMLRNTLTPKAGTSMATPVTAGAAVLVRSYFRRAFYSGEASSGLTTLFPSGFNPPAALVKAVLVNSAVPLKGTFCNENHGLVDLGDAVMVEQAAYEGHGRLSLADGLAIASIDQFFRLHVPGLVPLDEADDGDSETSALQPVLSATGDVHSYCFRMLPEEAHASFSSYPLQATLAWTDRAASPAAARYLCADLDLEVLLSLPGGNSSSPREKVILGNNAPGAFPQWPDGVNNVEKVRVVSRRGLEAVTNVTVRVAASGLPFGSQAYSLVVTGAIEPVACEPVEESRSTTPSPLPNSGSLADPPGASVAFAFAFIALAAVAMAGATYYLLSKRRHQHQKRPYETVTTGSDDESVHNPVVESQIEMASV